MQPLASPNASEPPQPTPEHAKRIAEILAKAGSAFPYRPKFRSFRGHVSAYIDEGPKDAPVLLCLHGNPTWSFFYRALIETYSKTMRVVVPDHMGMGLSEKPQDFVYDLESRIQAVEELVQDLDLQRINLVVHDWGGAIGLGFAGRHPKRMQRLILSNTAAFPGGRAHSLIRIARIPGFHALLMGRMGMFEKITVHHATRKGLSPAIRAAYTAPFGSPAERVAVRAFVRDIPLNARHSSYQTLLGVEAGLKNLAHLPALLLWGEKDWVFTPSFRKEFEVRLPKAESVPLPDTGHLLWEDDRETCLQAVHDFFERNPVPSKAQASPAQA